MNRSSVFSQVNYFLMFYKEGYRAVTYDKCQVDFHPYPFQRSLAVVTQLTMDIDAGFRWEDHWMVMVVAW